MRRSASEIIRELEGRIARLEGKTANKNSNLEILADWYTGGPRDDERHDTLSNILDECAERFKSQYIDLYESKKEGHVEIGTKFSIWVDIGWGVCVITSGVDDGSDSFQAGCTFCVWEAFVAAGCHRMNYKSAAKKLASEIKSKLSGFDVHIEIGKP